MAQLLDMSQALNLFICGIYYPFNGALGRFLLVLFCLFESCHVGLSVLGVARESRQLTGFALALAGVLPAFACWVLAGARGHLQYKGTKSLRAAEPDLILA